MGKRITIQAGELSLAAELNDSATAAAVYDALPVEAPANTWGEEVYFDIGVKLALEADAREEVAVGKLGYWPTGRAMCIFFGATPASGPDGAPRAASPVAPLGRLLGDPAALAAVRDGETITVSPG
jgi:hypothetical protein